MTTHYVRVAILNRAAHGLLGMPEVRPRGCWHGHSHSRSSKSSRRPWSRGSTSERVFDPPIERRIAVGTQIGRVLVVSGPRVPKIFPRLRRAKKGLRQGYRTCRGRIGYPGRTIMHVTLGSGVTSQGHATRAFRGESRRRRDKNARKPRSCLRPPQG